MFINVGKAGSDVTAMAEALGRIISLSLRMASPIPAMERAHKIAAELIGIGGARSLGFGENRVRSLPDAVAKVIDRHFGFFAKHAPATPAVGSGNAPTNGHTNGNGNGHTATLTTGTEAPVAEHIIPAGQQALFAQQRMVTVDLCPSCGEGSLVFEESCKKCYSCGYSEC
jgi:ribonucleoside-diphosphate reductase alpha chain